MHAHAEVSKTTSELIMHDDIHLAVWNKSLVLPQKLDLARDLLVAGADV